MAAHNVADSLSGGYDDEDDSMDTGPSGASNNARRAIDAIINYDLASKVAPATHLTDLGIQQLQALIIATVGTQHEGEIRRIHDKQHLLRLLTYIQKPGDVYDGQIPKPDVVEIPFEDLACKFTNDELAGTGGFSKVYRGMVYFTPCAIKVTRSVDPKVLGKLMPTLRKEVEIMRNNHPNVCGLLGICKNNNNLYICMELMEGNLEKYLRLRPELSALKRMDIVFQVARGLNWLHNQRPQILHLDLKLENVLHDKHATMKLTDFGLSAILSEDAGYVESKFRSPGNVGHMAPEVIMMQKFNDKADVYGFAILIWEILKGYEWETEVVDQLHDMRIDTSSGQLRQIVKKAVCQQGLRPNVENCPWPQRLKDLLKRMWDTDPTKRPDISNLLERDLDLVCYDFKCQVIENSMVDEQGKKFWLRNYDKFLEDPVPWKDFKVKFFNFLRITLPENEEDRNNIMVRRLLYLKLSLNAIKDEMVTLAVFAKVCDAFGPVVPGSTSFLDNIQVTVSNRWFRPDLSQEDAKSYLHGQDDGTFVVRFSSKMGVPFTLTRVKDGKIHQTRIYRFPDGFRVGEENSRWREIKFGSLMEIMGNPHIQKAFNLRNYPVLHALGPGEKLFLQPLIDTNYAPDLNTSGGILDELIHMSMNPREQYSFGSTGGGGSSFGR